MSEAPLPSVYDDVIDIFGNGHKNETQTDEDSHSPILSNRFSEMDCKIKFNGSPRHRQTKQCPHGDTCASNAISRKERYSPYKNYDLDIYTVLDNDMHSWRKRERKNASSCGLVFISLFAFTISLYNLILNWNLPLPEAESRFPMLPMSMMNIESESPQRELIRTGLTVPAARNNHYRSDKTAKKTKTREEKVLNLDTLLETLNDKDSTSREEKEAFFFSRHPPRTIIMDAESNDIPANGRRIQQFPAVFSDATQLYPVVSSDDALGLLVSQKMKRKLFPDNEVEPDGECTPLAEWQTNLYPTCNSFHEVDIGKNLLSFFIGLVGTKGYWRHAWKLTGEGASEQSLLEHPAVVMKTLRYEHDYEENYFETNRIDAVAMERLSSSRHVIDIYGYCGMSAINEFASGQFKPLVDASRAMEKLRLARDVALGLAAVHGIDGDNVTLVHNDINPSNLVVKNDVVKLNDFNIGVLKTWNTKKGSPCHFVNRFPNSQWRSPEEQMIGEYNSDEKLSEKIDIYALGNIFYRMIVGHDPWSEFKASNGRISEEDQAKIAKLKRIQGAMPALPKNIEKTTSGPTKVIRVAMKECFKFNPDERPSARQIASKLSQEYQRLKNKKRGRK